MEAPTRFELVMEVLQTSALPLGDGAAQILAVFEGPVGIAKAINGVKAKSAPAGVQSKKDKISMVLMIISVCFQPT